MKERPVLFSAPMVRAILEGRKTQTRRIVKMPSDLIDRVQFVRAEFADKSTPGQCGAFWVMEDGGPVGSPISCKYGQAGDRLWVRETYGDCTPGADALTGTKWQRPWYRADADAYGLLGHDGDGPVYVEDVKWRPSIHMPRLASRIGLEVTGVRVERLQDISEADAIAEGIELLHGRYTFNGGLHESRSAVNAFFALWDSVHGQGAWDANPWVWVVEFRRVKP